MAHSIQVVGDRHEVINDGDLLALIGFMLQEFESNATNYPLVTPAALKWKDSCDHYGPGTINLDLDIASAKQETKLQVTALLSAVRKTLLEFDETIPASTLNARAPTTVIIFSDYQVDLLLTALDKIESLIA